MSKRSNDEMGSAGISLEEKKAKACIHRDLSILKKATSTGIEKVRLQKVENKSRLDTAAASSSFLTPTASDEEPKCFLLQEIEEINTADIAASPESEKTVDGDLEAAPQIQGTGRSELNVRTPESSSDCDGNPSTLVEAIQPMQEALGVIKNPIEARKRPGTDLEGGEPVKKPKQIKANGREPKAPRAQKAIAAPGKASAITNNGDGNLSRKQVRRRTPPRATALPSPSASSSPAEKATSPPTPVRPSTPRMAYTPSPSGSEYEEDADLSEGRVTAAPSGKRAGVGKRKLAPAATEMAGDYQSEDDDEIRRPGKRTRLARVAAKAMLKPERSKARAAIRAESSSEDSSLSEHSNLSDDSSLSEDSSWSESSDGSSEETESPAGEGRSLSSTTSAPGVRRAATGLMNHGKSCYHNAVLQCLAHTKPIREHYMATADATPGSSGSSESEDELQRIVSSCGRTGTRGRRLAFSNAYKGVASEEVSLSAAFSKVVSQMVHGPGDPEKSYISPIRFIAAYAAIYGEEYDGSMSQDAHETLCQTLNRLKEEGDLNGGTSVLTAVESAFQGMTATEHEEFLEFGVNMPAPLNPKANHPSDPVAIGGCFDVFGEREEHCDRKCANCGKAGGISGVSTLFSVPSHLLVHVRRWRVVGHGGIFSTEKDATKVNFPVQDDLDLSPWVSDSAGADPNALKYELYGVIEHRGSGYRDGHYVAYVKRDDGWWEMDDGAPVWVKPHVVGKANPYLLFYRNQ
ncbi:hypothetical protein FGG08_006182 [Glutinoglossum americanum]|uniref:USP domain-containing protein n=1 Tax=Glutinoglossum americanum TaxID=1670608 RepID=A0A9P8HYU7_9PEZI|nr:hypothetical protein FGG08_006182 [Glutinoglossum americanum]